MPKHNKFISRLRPLGFAVALGFAFVPAAQATTLSDLLTFDGPQHLTAFPVQGGGEDRLQDDSLTAIVNADGSVNELGLPTFTMGDTIWGVATLSDIQASGNLNYTVGVNEQIAILFSFTNVDGVNLAPGTGAFSLSSICGLVCAGAGIDASSSVVVLSTTDATDDPLNYTTANFTTNFNSGSWTWEMTLGFVGDSFLSFLDGGLLGSTERGALGVQSSAFAANWVGVDVLDFGGATHINDVTLDDGDVQFAGVEATSRGWAYEDQAAFFVNPTAVPEPSTLALMGIALAGLGGAAQRRRKQ